MWEVVGSFGRTPAAAILPSTKGPSYTPPSAKRKTQRPCRLPSWRSPVDSEVFWPLSQTLLSPGAPPEAGQPRCEARPLQPEDRTQRRCEPGAKQRLPTSEENLIGLMAVNRELIAQAGPSAKMWGQEIHFHAELHHRLLRARSFATDNTRGHLPFLF